RGAHLHDALALAGVLSRATVAGAGAGALPLARVDSGAGHLVAAFLLRGARGNGARQKQGGSRAGNHDSFDVHPSSSLVWVVDSAAAGALKVHSGRGAVRRAAMDTSRPMPTDGSDEGSLARAYVRTLGASSRRRVLLTHPLGTPYLPTIPPLQEGVPMPTVY